MARNATSRASKAAAPATDKLAVSIAEAAKKLGVSPRTFMRQIAAGEVRTIKFGGRRLVPVEALQELVRAAA